jgi:hypothetical protein
METIGQSVMTIEQMEHSPCLVGILIQADLENV